MVFAVKLPAGFHVNKDAPQKFDAKVEGAGISLAKTKIRNQEFALPLRVAFSSGKVGAKGVLVVDATINYCDDDATICKVKSFQAKAPFEIRVGGAKKFQINSQINADDSVQRNILLYESTGEKN